MSSPTPLAEDRQEFERTLGALVRAAERADVDVRTADEIAAAGEGHWEVEITRVRDGDNPR